MARSSFEGLKTGTGRADTSTGEPVRGFRAIRVLRWRILNVPKPRTSMFFWPLQGFLDRLEERVDDARTVFLGNHRPRSAGDLSRDFLDQVGFGHAKCLVFRRPGNGGTRTELSDVNSYVSRVWPTSGGLGTDRLHELVE